MIISLLTHGYTTSDKHRESELSSNSNHKISLGSEKVDITQTWNYFYSLQGTMSGGVFE